MSMFYSPSTGGFYDTNVSPNKPSDAVAVTAEAYTALMTAQATTEQIITADSNGNPIAAAAPAPTTEQAQSALALAARAALDMTDNVFIRCGKAAVAWPAEWQSFVLALRAIVANPASATELPATPSYPPGT